MMLPTYLRSLASILVSTGLLKNRINEKYGEPFTEDCLNINHEKQFLFVHNPKCGGTSMMRVLGLDQQGGAEHRDPTNLVHPKTWERYFTFTIVRHPLERLKSSWRYHTNPEYDGFYYQRAPELHSLNLEEYFHKMKGFRFCIRPQWEYTYHMLSPKRIDVVCKLENLEKDIKLVFHRLGLPEAEIPQLNVSSKSLEHDLLTTNSGFRSEVIRYYKEDFRLFGYPVSWESE